MHVTKLLGRVQFERQIISKLGNFTCHDFRGVCNVKISMAATGPKRKGDDVTFLNRVFLAFLIVARQNK